MAMDLEQFAADRDQDLLATSALLLPAVVEALEDDDSSVIAEAAGEVVALEYRSLFGDDTDPSLAVSSFLADIEDTVALTEPDPENIDAQAKRISDWLATAALGAAVAYGPTGDLVKTWVTMRDEAVRATHLPLDGTTVDMEDTFTVKTDPPATPLYPGQPVGPVEAWINCVAENSQIAWTGQDVLGSTRRDYSGPLVDLVTEDGHRLTVTPNHPVLTTRGYVDAGTLAPGDQVLATPQPVTPEVTDAPPSAKEFHRAASKLWSKQRVRGSRMDFHGDGTENEVEVVRPHGDLTTPTGEPGELVFVGTSVGQSLLSGSRPPEQPGSGVGVLAAGPPSEVADFEGSRSLVGSKGVGPPFSGSHPAHTQPVSLGAVALDEAELPHPALDGPARDPESIAHLQDAHALGMKPSKLIQVHLYAGTTFVHNLHTSRNHYSANGIQVHNCRCVLALGNVDGLTAAGGFSGVVLVALPEGDGTVEYADGDSTELHQTIAYLGTTDQLEPGEQVALMELGEALASEMSPFTARVAGMATLGEDQDQVALTEAPELQALHDAAMSNETIGRMYRERNQHPTWISHVTGAPVEPGDEIRFDRIGVWLGGDDHTTFEMGATVNEDEIEVPEDAPPAPAEPIPAEDENMPVYGIAAPEGVESGDGRKFAVGSLTHRELPLPLTWQRAAATEHEGEVVVGRVDTLEKRDDGMWHYTGELLTDVPETEEVIGLIAQRALRGVSIAADSGILEPATDEEVAAAMAAGRPPVDTWAEARMSGLTIVQIPAFQEAFIALGVEGGSEPEASEAIAADAGTESFKRGSGWITNPEETKTLHDYWTKGEGAAKIRWGTNGDFTRCTRQLRKYIEPRFLNRTCAEWHHDALGYWPGELGKPGNPTSRNSSDCIDCEDQAMIAASANPNHSHTFNPNHSHSITFGGALSAPALTLTAAAPPETVDADWFRDPKFSAPTALVVEKSGRVYGHIAKWGTCHIGLSGQCVTPPHSKTDYAHFHLGAVETTEGMISCGSLTLGTGHADLHLSGSDTRRHYDHTGTAVAKVRAGEDEHGIWVAGSLCEGVTDDQRRTLMAAGGISGDWRSIGGALELVAGLAVNVPGFPVERPALAASGDQQNALVAAGVVVHEPDPSVDAIADAVVARIEAKQQRAERFAALRSTAAEARKHRVESLAASAAE